MNQFKKIILIFQGIAIAFFLIVLTIMLVFHIFYNLFDVKIILVLVLFLLFLIFWLIVELKEDKISNVKLEETEKLMNLRMQNSFGLSTFLIAISIPFVTSGNITSDWTHTLLFCIGMLMIIGGFAIWVIIYEPRYGKLEKFYLKDAFSRQVPD
jgi:hypothetical protein